MLEFPVTGETGTALAPLFGMSRRSRVIRFPVEQTGPAREVQRVQRIAARVNALPAVIQELDVAWIFKMAEQRRLKTRP